MPNTDDTNESNTTRRHKRYNVAWLVKITTSDWEDALHLVTDNVSRGGLFIRSSTPIDCGTQLEIRLSLPDGTTLSVEGTIVHLVTPERAKQQGLAAGFGVRIDEKHALDLSLLESIAASNAGGEHHYILDESYITLPAVLLGAEGSMEVQTTAHHLVEPPGSGAMSDADIPLDIAPPEEDPDREDAPPPAPEAPDPSSPAPLDAVPPHAPGRSFTEAAYFGIDFGTSYTSIALAHADRVEVLADEQGKPMIPSVICYPETGSPLVGWTAREKMATNPSTTISSPKRLIGRRYDDPHIQPFLASTPVRMSEGPQGQIISQLYGESYAIPQVCAEIFRRIAHLGQQRSGQEVRQVVLSAPVAYQKERSAIKRAAELAGLQVMGMIDEPVAAALAYGLGHEGGRLIAVYDFGGGTFDFSLLQIMHGGGFQILGSAGDPWLGGLDFDRAIAEHVADLFWQQRKVDLRTRQVEWQILLFLAENAKLKLSIEQEAAIHAPGILLSIHGPIDLSLTIDRATFTELCQQLVSRSIETMSSCLDLCNVNPAEIDHVVLTGGMSRSPIVRQQLQKYFQREIPLLIDPELAIVTGNAIYARYLMQQARAGKE